MGKCVEFGRVSLSTFKKFQLPEDVLAAVKKDLRKTFESKLTYHEDAIVRVRKEYDSIQTKLDRLLDMRLEQNYT